MLNNKDNKDGIIDKALDELFEEEFDKRLEELNRKTEEEFNRLFEEEFDNYSDKENFTHTILNIPKINETDNYLNNIINVEEKNNSIKDDIIPSNNKKIFNKTTTFGKKVLLASLVLIIVMSLGYTLFNDKIMINGTASVRGVSDISYECNIINDGELKSSGSGSCNISKNNITTKSMLYKPTDSVNYNVIVTNKGDFPIKLIKLLSSNNKNLYLTNSGDEIFINDDYLSGKYAIYYNGKEIIGDRLSSNSNIVLNPGESFIIIINHNWVSTDEQPHLNDNESINYSVMMTFDQIIN